MRRIISLISAALTLAACSNPTGPVAGDQSAATAKAKAALGGVANGTNGRLVGN
jgi:hypothetical protein